jgi:hypothetical protein
MRDGMERWLLLKENFGGKKTIEDYSFSLLRRIYKTRKSVAPYAEEHPTVEYADTSS